MSAFSQDQLILPFNRMELPSTLPNHFINTILRDQYGFLWLGTNEGLCRYTSSQSFKVFSTHTDSIQLASNLIEALLEDSQGNLWIGTRHGGISRYNREEDTWKIYLHDDADSTSLINNDVNCIYEDKKGRIWIGTEKGLNLYINETDSFLPFYHVSNDTTTLSKPAILDVREDDNGWLWVGTWAGGLNLMLEHPSGNICKNRFKRIRQIASANEESVWRVFQDSGNRYWICTHFSGLYLMQLPTHASNEVGHTAWEPTFHNYSSSGPNALTSQIHLSDIGQDNSGSIWIATADGLTEIPPDQLPDTLEYNQVTAHKPPIEFTQHWHDPFNNKSISGNSPKSICIDEQNLVWIGTDHGLTQYNSNDKSFKAYRLPSDENIIHSVEELYVPSSERVLLRYSTGELMLYHIQSGRLSPADTYFPFLPNIRDALYLMEYEKGNLIIIRKKSISKVDFIHKREQTVALHPDLVRHFEQYRIKEAMQDNQGRIWIGGERGLFVVYDQGQRYQIFYTHNQGGSISDNSITDIIMDKTGIIWVSTHNGLNKVIEEPNERFRFVQFVNDADDPESLPTNRLLALESLGNTLYLGSRNGLFAYDLVKEQFSDLNNGILSPSVYSLISVGNDNLWASSGGKVWNYHIPTKELTEYRDNEISFSEGSIYADYSGKLFVGGSRGFVSFHPEKIQQNTVPPRITLTDVRVIHTGYTETYSVIGKEQVILEPSYYQITLSFISSNMVKAQYNQYAYRLLGFDSTWVYTSTNQPVVYTNLNPGTYTFQVLGRNNDGIWGIKPGSLQIVVKPALWQTAGFKILILLCMILFVYLFITLYTQNVRKQNQKLLEEIYKRKEIEQELKMSNVKLEKSNQELEQFAFVASHDLKEPLQTIDSFSRLLDTAAYKGLLDEKGAKSVEFIRQGASRMLEVIQSLLSYATNRQSTLELTPCDFSLLIQDTLSDLAERIEERHAQVELGTFPEGLCDKVQLRMVFNNLMLNALKFNRKEVPIIRVWGEAREGKLIFSVQDNGIGIEEEFQEKVFGIFKRLHRKDEFEGSGIGLALCRKIIERHGGEIWFESQPGKGSTFHFSLPHATQQEANFPNSLRKKQLQV